MGVSMLREIVARTMRRLLIASVMLSAVGALGGQALADGVISGRVMSKGKPLEGYGIAVFATGTERGVPLPPEPIGIGLSDLRGRFVVRYRTPSTANAVIYVLAARSSVVLASALGPEATLPGAITINERTTVATGFAFAQFIQGAEISGNRYGVSNAVHMAANLANVVTGEIAEVLGTPPNGPDTSLSEISLR
jgi:hypothetical protein